MAVAPAPALSLLSNVPSRNGVIIDPVFEQHDRDLSLLRELGIDLVASIDTHAHADHITGRSVTSVAEEKAFNARLGGNATERDFVGHRENMKLPHSRRIAEALPGNRRSGKPRETATTPAWAPLVRSNAGLPELSPAWVAAHRSDVTVLDVAGRWAAEGYRLDGAVQT